MIVRKPKGEIKKGNTISFEGFPFRFISYLDTYGYEYEVKKDKLIEVSILSDRKNEKGKVFERKVRRVERRDEFDINTGIEPKDKDPNVYKEYVELRDKFKKKGRVLHVFCLENLHHVALETCICRCRKKCSSLMFRNLVGDGEGMCSYMTDFLKLQRLVNILYGTVRKKDLELDL